MNYMSTRFQRIWKEMRNPQALELMKELSNAKDDSERKRVLLSVNDMLPTGLQGSPKYWAEDISFFLGRLKEMTKAGGLFQGRLDLGRIGVFGMSLGGSCRANYA